MDYIEEVLSHEGADLSPLLTLMANTRGRSERLMGEILEYHRVERGTPTLIRTALKPSLAPKGAPEALVRCFREHQLIYDVDFGLYHKSEHAELNAGMDSAIEETLLCGRGALRVIMRTFGSSLRALEKARERYGFDILHYRKDEDSGNKLLILEPAFEHDDLVLGFQPGGLWLRYTGAGMVKPDSPMALMIGSDIKNYSR